MSMWFIGAFIILFLVSSSFILFFNPAVMKKPLIKMASRNEDAKRQKKNEGDQNNA